MKVAKRYAMSVHDLNRKKVGDIFDTEIPSPGAAEDVRITKERNGWKEISFSISQYLTDGSRNEKCDYIRNEFQIRLTEGSKTDWYSIVVPTDIHDGEILTFNVTCEHISGSLKAKNLAGYFDDTNGIGTCQELVRRALYGTGWTLKSCDIFYEADGETEKIRSYACDEKTGAWAMIEGICNLFHAYPIYDGENRTVTIRERRNFDGLMEVTFGKNTEKIERRLDSGSLITRLFVHGDYSDAGYVGIDTAKSNERGLDFICNFDYYREIGLFGEDHEAALELFLERKTTCAQNMRTATTALLELQREFGEEVSTYGVVYYEIADGEVVDTFAVNTVPADEMTLRDGDELAAVEMSGDTCTGYKYFIYDEAGVFPANTRYAVKFITTINGALMTAENFANTAEATIEKQEDPAAGADLQAKVKEYRDKANGHMGRGIVLAREIGNAQAEIQENADESENAEEDFAKAMGEMLREGYWTDSQYIPGQEDALYADALEISAEMARPQCDWTIALHDLSFCAEYTGEEFDVNRRLRIYDEKTRLKAYAFVDKVVIHPEEEWDNEIAISTDELGLNGKSLENILSRVTDMAEILRENASIYDRATAITDEGNVMAQLLEGMIDVSKNRILSVGSNWYTDAQGNIMFVALDGGSAMMLTGMGFMIADNKTDDGKWNWRTFGTGAGFTADLITVGYLNADRIRAGSIAANKLAADVGESLNLSSNQSVNFLIGDAVSEALTDYAAWMRFTEDGLEIGKADSNVSLMLTNDKISFMQSGKEVAHISDEKINITHAEIESTMRVGRFRWEPQENGNMSLIYIGSEEDA